MENGKCADFPFAIFHFPFTFFHFMRTLGIDLGSRRIGIALSDEGGTFATPLEVLEVSSPGRAIEAVLSIITKQGVSRIVVGLPLNMDDTPGPAARETVAWGRELAAKAGLPVIFVDERLSSFAA